MTTLREAAQQALEALEWISDCHVGDDDDAGECASCHERSYKPHASDCKKNNAITALRAALAQQAEPVQVAERERIAAQWDGCVTHQLDAFGPVNIGASIRAGELVEAQQAEPAQEPVAWVASKDGRVIYDDTSTDDGLLRVSGDFEDDEQRSRYAQRIVDKLNAASAQQAEPVQEPVGEVLHDWSTEKECIAGTWAHLNDLGKNLPVGTKLYTAPPQRTMVPLTEEEIDALPWNGSPQQFARAVEKASWEKNHGQA